MPRAPHLADLTDASDQLREIDRRLDRDAAHENGFRTGPADIFAPLPLYTLEQFCALGRLFDMVYQHNADLFLAERDTPGAGQALIDWGRNLKLTVEEVLNGNSVRCSLDNQRHITVWRGGAE